MRGSLLFAASFLSLVGGGCGKNPAFECEFRVLLPPTSVDPVTGSKFGRLTINGQERPEGMRLRAFKIKLRAAKDSITVVYSFWPRTYTNVIRSKVVPVENGQVVQVDLTSEDPEHPDQVQAIFVSTPMPVVERMCKLANIGADDVVYDIGCGDGRMVITAVAKFAAKKGVGIDIDPKRIEESRENAKRAGVLQKIDFRAEDALKLKDLSEASVVMLFVGEDLNQKLRPILQQTLKPGARVVSHHFDMGDWKPDKTEKFMALNKEGVKEEYALHLWTIK